MKKTISFLLLIALVLSLTACGSAPATSTPPSIPPTTSAPAPSTPAPSTPATTTPSSTPPPPAKPAKTFDADKIAAGLEVREYSYINSIKHPWVFLVVKNTSEYSLEISGSLKTFDASGALLGAKSTSEEAVAPGTETLLVFMLDEQFAKTEYEITVEEETWYTCVTQDLTYESSTAKKKEVMTVTNNGSIPAEFVEGLVLFFSGDKLVGYSSTYFTDNDSELKPGKSITKEISCYETYDSFLVFFTGRA